MKNKQKQNKRWAVTMIVLSVVLLGLIAFTAYKIFPAPGAKMSTVTKYVYSSYMDGCDGYRLANGDFVTTFCFWTGPEAKVGPDKIEVGDTVEYSLEEGEEFIRLK